MDSINVPKKRVEWIDTAKGVCICLVVLHHIFASYGLYTKGIISSHIYYSLQSFRIPLYFVLSGLFSRVMVAFFFYYKDTSDIL